ncbi:phospholipase D family protein [Pseudolysinimonas sp.]
MYLQSPGSDDKLIDVLAQQAATATRGGGAFAWATAGGVEALFETDAFQELLGRGSFDLVVGTDSITDARAVSRLAGYVADHPSLTVSMKVNDSGALFHPKFSWFESEDELTLVVGSGNLTVSGLNSNWEAFLVHEFTGDDAGAQLARIQAWIELQRDSLHPTDAPEVLVRVADNAGWEKSIRTARRATRSPGSAPAAEEWLVAELPKNRNGFSQADMSRKVFVDFFGYQDAPREILLAEVTASGDAQIQPTTLRRKSSSNYYFELPAARGFSYPTDGRPIAVFARSALDTFYYALTVPDDPGHAELSALLDEKVGSAAIRRASGLSASDVEEFWTECPIFGIADS